MASDETGSTPIKIDECQNALQGYHEAPTVKIETNDKPRPQDITGNNNMSLNETSPTPDKIEECRNVLQNNLKCNQ